MDPGAGSHPEADAIRLQLERILASGVFAGAKRSRTFLRYVVERSLRKSVPKEYEIAVEVLDRGADYDPDVDATVRVEAGRLRSRLREYYDVDGRADPVLIEIPKGGYKAVFDCRELPPNHLALDYGRSREAGSAEVQSPPAADARSKWTRWRFGSAKWWFAVSVGVAAILLGELLLHWANGRRVQASGPVRSLAVLPLQNLSGDPSEEYFAEGMTDALITELASAPHLRVVSRTSVMQDAGTKKPLRQIASELGVDAVVEGSIMRSGDRVRITAQLIDARDDRHLWAKSFEKPMLDVLTLQDDVAREIALQTRAVLTSSQSIHRDQVNPAAYDAYLRGLYLLNRREMSKSLVYLRQAVSLDSSYAPAYAGLAEALTTDGVSGGSIRPGEQAEALGAARRAIQLDPDNGEAYTALGFVELNYGKDWSSAGLDLEKGLALSPNNSLAEMQYSIYLDAMGRPEDAVAHMRRAVQLDPRSFLMNRHLGAVFYLARHYDEALLYLQRALEIEPTKLAYADGWMSRSYEMTGRFDEAEQADLAQLGVTMGARRLAPLRSAYRRGGWKSYQAARLRLLAKQPRNGCDLYEVGESYLRLGDRNQALSWLARGEEAGCFWADSLPVDPLLDDIRGDARFPELLKGVRLEGNRR